MIKLIDTVVLVGALSTENEHHQTALKYLNSIRTDEETLVPITCLIEFDLVMKGRNYSSNQRKSAFSWLSYFIPDTKIIASSVSSLEVAVDLEETGMSYFDSILSALAIEQNATVLTTDKMISQRTQTEW